MSEGARVAGRLAVLVEASLKGFKQKLEAGVEKASAGVEAQVGVELNGDGLRKALEAKVKEAAAGVTATIGIDVDAADLKAKVEAAAKTASATVKVNTEVDTGSVVGEVQAAAAAAEASTGDVRLSVRARAKRLIQDVFRARAEAQAAATAAGDVEIPVRASAKGGGIFGSLFGSGGGGPGGRGGLRGRTLFRGSIIFSLLSLIQPAVGALGQLVAGLTAMVGAADSALGTIAALPIGIAGLVQTFAAGKIATQGLGEAFQLLAKQQAALANGDKLDPADQEKLNEALKELSPSARKFAREVVGLRGAWVNMRKGVQEALFKPLVGQIKPLATSLLPLLRRELSATSSVLGTNVAATSKFLQTKDAQGDIGKVMSNNNIILGDFLYMIGQFGQAGLDFLVGSRKFGRGMGSLMREVGDFVAGKAAKGRRTGGIEDFLDRASAKATQLWNILRQFGKGFGGILRAATPSGERLLDKFETFLTKWQRWVNSLQGQQYLRRWFNDAQGGFVEFSRLIDDTFKGIAKWAADPKIKRMLRMIRTELGPALGDFFDKLAEDNGENVINLLTQLVGIADSLEPMIEPISELTSALADLLEVVNNFAAANPGAMEAVAKGIGSLLVYKTLFGKGGGAGLGLLGLLGGRGGKGGGVGAVGRAGLLASLFGGRGGKAAVGGPISKLFAGKMNPKGRLPSLRGGGGGGGLLGALLGVGLLAGAEPGTSGNMQATLGGAAAGSSIGSIIPGLGTLAGAGLGAAGGFTYGTYKSSQAQQAAQQKLITNGGSLATMLAEFAKLTASSTPAAKPKQTTVSGSFGTVPSSSGATYDAARGLGGATTALEKKKLDTLSATFERITGQSIPAFQAKLKTLPAAVQKSLTVPGAIKSGKDLRGVFKQLTTDQASWLSKSLGFNKKQTAAAIATSRIGAQEALKTKRRLAQTSSAYQKNNRVIDGTRKKVQEQAKAASKAAITWKNSAVKQKAASKTQETALRKLGREVQQVPAKVKKMGNGYAQAAKQASKGTRLMQADAKKTANAVSKSFATIPKKAKQATSQTTKQVENMGRTVAQKTKGLKSDVSKAMDGVVKAVASKVGPTKAAATKVANGAKTPFNGLRGEMQAAGVNAMAGLEAGIYARGAAAVAAARSIAAQVAAASRSQLKIKSPSRVMMEIGRYVVDGLVAGVKAGTGKVEKTMKHLLAGVGLTMKQRNKLRARLLGYVKGGMLDVLQGSVGKIKSAWHRIQKILEKSPLGDSKDGKKKIRALKDTLREEMKELEKQARKRLALQKRIAKKLADLADLRDRKQSMIDAAKDNASESGSLGALASDVTTDKENALAAAADPTAAAADAAQKAATHVTLADLLAKLRQKAADWVKWRGLLAQLRKNGLGEDGYQQLLALGIDEGMPIAEELAKGSADQIAELNSLQSQIGDTGQALGDESGQAYFDAGIDLAEGALKHLRDKMKDLRHAGREMAEALVDHLKDLIGKMEKPKKKKKAKDGKGDGGDGGEDSGDDRSGRGPRGPAQTVHAAGRKARTEVAVADAGTYNYNEAPLVAGNIEVAVEHGNDVASAVVWELKKFRARGRTRHGRRSNR